MADIAGPGRGAEVLREPKAPLVGLILAVALAPEVAAVDQHVAPDPRRRPSRSVQPEQGGRLSEGGLGRFGEVADDVAGRVEGEVRRQDVVGAGVDVEDVEGPGVDEEEAGTRGG